MLRAADCGQAAGDHGVLWMTQMLATSIEPAVAADLPGIRSLLEKESLPGGGLAIGPDSRFWVVREPDRLLGAIGLERYGHSGLLRSLVVAPEARGAGVGGQLVVLLEKSARTAGIHRLVLLTQTAETFFSNRGYTVIERSTAPAGLHQSSEFKSVCPASATCMLKTLSEPT